MRCQIQGHGANLLRFDGEHHHFGALDRARVVGGGPDAVFPDQALQLLLVRIGNHHPLIRQAAFGQAPDQRSGHIAAAYERKPTYVVHDRPSFCRPWLHRARTVGVVCLPGERYDRLPNNAVPIRTSVAPSAMADSKSPLIPIDSVSSLWPLAFSSSSRVRRRANTARAAEAFGCGGGTHISPRKRARGSSAAAAPTARTPPGPVPPLLGARTNPTCMQR